MSYKNLLVTDADSVRTITINRPDQLNALNRDTIAELNKALTAAEADKSIRVVLLTGSGQKAFVAGADLKAVTTETEEFKAVENDVRSHYDRLLNIKGSRTVRDIHWDLGRIMWDKVGMARNKDGLNEAIGKIKELQKAFWQDLALTGSADDLNKQLEQANRLGDYLELGELMARDALMREESCGGHFREEHQSETGEAKRDDENFMFVSAWEHQGEGQEPVMHKEDLSYENIEVKTRSYK